MAANVSPWVTTPPTSPATREKVLDPCFVADGTAELWRREVFDFAVSHSEVDNSGYDLIIEAQRVVRHIQLKAMHVGSTTAEFPVQARLMDKPSACVVLIRHDARTLAITEYRWFGGEPGAPLPTLGDQIGKHTRPNALGIKGERPAIRRLQKRRFEPLSGIGMLVDRLFGRADALPCPATWPKDIAIPGGPLMRG